MLRRPIVCRSKPVERGARISVKILPAKFQVTQGDNFLLLLRAEHAGFVQGSPVSVTYSATAGNFLGPPEMKNDIDAYGSYTANAPLGVHKLKAVFQFVDGVIAIAHAEVTVIFGP